MWEATIHFNTCVGPNLWSTYQRSNALPLHHGLHATLQIHKNCAFGISFDSSSKGTSTSEQWCIYFSSDNTILSELDTLTPPYRRLLYQESTMWSWICCLWLPKPFNTSAPVFMIFWFTVFFLMKLPISKSTAIIMLTVKQLLYFKDFVFRGHQVLIAKEWTEQPESMNICVGFFMQCEQRFLFRERPV